ncbi:MAG: hypothetical protein JWM16_5379 [Verrucomicrobiales bacterium]|nr:hypothetical protein [Verrucomicrobiales bacterium]
MQLHLPPDISSRLIEALTEAGRREIGGILMGEHVGPDTFVVRDITIQRKGGTFAAFLRAVSEILGPLRAFFDSTKHDYKKFNYLGEWHSHHSFQLHPSSTDHATMCDMIMDPNVGANFVVLLLVKVGSRQNLEAGLTVYQPNKRPYAGNVDM